MSGGNRRLTFPRALLALWFCAGLLLAACTLPSVTIGVQTAAPPAPAAARTSSASPAVPTASVQNTATAAPRLPGLVTPENAVRLTFTTLSLPEYPARLLWVGQDTELPGKPEPAPDLVVFSGSSLHPIRLRPAEVGQPLPFNVPGEVQDFAPDLSSVAVRDETWQVRLYDLAGKQLHTFGEPLAYGASYSPDGRLLAVTSQNEFAASLYDVASGRQVTRLTGFETAAPVFGVDIAPGGKTIAWHARATLVLQDVATGQIGQRLSYQDFISAFAFSPGGTRMVVYVEGKLLLYTIPDAQILAEISLSRPVAALAYSPDGRLLVGGYGPALQLWDAATLAPLASLPGPNSFTGQVTFSLDGAYLVTTHEDNLVAVWSVGK